MCFVRMSSGLMPRKSLVARRAPLGQSRGGERRPARFERAVEHVAVGEVLDDKAVRVAPVVEDLATLDVTADSPGPLITMVFKVFTAGGQRVEVAHLIRRMHVAVRRTQRYCERVVIGRRRCRGRSGRSSSSVRVRADREEHEVADDHAEVVEVPVQRRKVVRALQRRRGRAAERSWERVAAVGWR